MKKKPVFFVILIIGIVSAAPAAEQFFFDFTSGLKFYPVSLFSPVLGAKFSWALYGKDKYGDDSMSGGIFDISYYNNGLLNNGLSGNWREEINIAHNFGLAAGWVVNWNRMDIARTAKDKKGNIIVIPRTSHTSYLKLKGVLHLGNELKLYPGIDFMLLKWNIFPAKKPAGFSIGLGADYTWPQRYPTPYISVGAVFQTWKHTYTFKNESGRNLRITITGSAVSSNSFVISSGKERRIGTNDFLNVKSIQGDVDEGPKKTSSAYKPNVEIEPVDGKKEFKCKING